MTRANRTVSASFRLNRLSFRPNIATRCPSRRCSEAYNLRPGMTDAELTRQLKIVLCPAERSEQRIGNQRYR
jgi:hypothetical protein